MNNKQIISYLKKRSKFSQKYYNNPTDENKDLLVNTATEYSRLIIATKEKNLIRLSNQLEDPNTVPET